MQFVIVIVNTAYFKKKMKKKEKITKRFPVLLSCMSLRLVPINAMLGLEVFMGTLQQQLDTLLWSKNIKAIKFKSKRSTPSRNREIKEAAMAESGGGSGSVPTRMPIEVELSVRTPVSDNDIILLVNPVAPVPFLIAGVGGIGGSGERRRDEKAGVEECKIQTPPRFFWSATPTPSQINLLQQYIYLQQQRRTYATRLTSAFDLMKQKARTMYQDEGQVPRHLPVLRPSIKFASKLAPIDEGGFISVGFSVDISFFFVLLAFWGVSRWRA